MQLVGKLYVAFLVELYFNTTNTPVIVRTEAKKKKQCKDTKSALLHHSLLQFDQTARNNNFPM